MNPTALSGAQIGGLTRFQRFQRWAMVGRAPLRRAGAIGLVHDLLAHLAGRMIETHREKQERVGALWLDLEGVADAETFEVLHDNGTWESSLWKAEACRSFVDGESRARATWTRAWTGMRIASRRSSRCWWGRCPT